MTDLQNDPAVVKLLEFAKRKKTITYDEVNDFLPEQLVNSDRIEEVIALLVKHKVRLEEEDLSADVEEEKPERKKMLVEEKESAVDDPIRLYLREIGKESLLTAEQEVILSKRMEEGENIIKGVIRHSGILIPEFYRLAVRTHSRVDPRDLNMSKKEISEFLAERRRLTQYYREPLKEVFPLLKQFMETKKKVENDGGNALREDGLDGQRDELIGKLSGIDLHQEEIASISDRFAGTAAKIRKIQGDKKKIRKRLNVNSPKEMRALSRRLAQKSACEHCRGGAGPAGGQDQGTDPHDPGRRQEAPEAGGGVPELHPRDPGDGDARSSGAAA